MEPGKYYLIHSLDWHTFVGEYAEQVSPLLHRFVAVSKVSNTNNGDNWHELCADEPGTREAATFVHYANSAYLPISIIAFDWIGKLPQ